MKEINSVKDLMAVSARQGVKMNHVEAASWEEAKSKVEQEWNNGEHVLTAEDFAGVSFNTGSLEVR